MAVNPCKECGGPVSTKADKCPRCGAKVAKSASHIFVVFILLFGGYVIYMYGQYSNALSATSTASSTHIETVDKPVLPNPLGKWEVSESISEKDDSKNVYLYLEANTPVSGWLNRIAVPKIVLRCKEQNTDAILNLGLTPDVEAGNYGHKTISIRFDKEKAKNITVDEAVDNETVFFQKPVGIVKQMLEHETMLVSFSAFNHGEVSTSFNLHGLSEALKPLRSSCKW